MLPKRQQGVFCVDVVIVGRGLAPAAFSTADVFMDMRLKKNIFFGDLLRHIFVWVYDIIAQGAEVMRWSRRFILIYIF